MIEIELNDKNGNLLDVIKLDDDTFLGLEETAQARNMKVTDLIGIALQDYARKIL